MEGGGGVGGFREGITTDKKKDKKGERQGM
jgi:hypothetical protein